MEARNPGHGLQDLLYGKFVTASARTVANCLRFFSGSEIGPNADIDEWLKRCVVKASCPLDVLRANRHVVEHVLCAEIAAGSTCAA